jgi:hypothetical protein
MNQRDEKARKVQKCSIRRQVIVIKEVEIDIGEGTSGVAPYSGSTDLCDITPRERYRTLPAKSQQRTSSRNRTRLGRLRQTNFRDRPHRI